MITLPGLLITARFLCVLYAEICVSATSETSHQINPDDFDLNQFDCSYPVLPEKLGNPKKFSLSREASSMFWCVLTRWHIDRLQGYATVLADDGSPLSPYQKHLLALARALIAQPKILLWEDDASLMDDATLDSLVAHLNRVRNIPIFYAACSPV